MKTVTFGFSRPRTWKIFAEAIMWVDGSNISHGYTKFCSNSWGTQFIYQNSGHKTHFVGGELFNKLNIAVEEYTVDVPDEVEIAVGKLCVSREGKPYALKQVFGKGLVIIVRWVSFKKIEIKNPFSDGDSETDCIEELAKIIALGLGIEVKLDMDTVSVKPFRDWVASLPQVRQTLKAGDIQ